MDSKTEQIIRTYVERSGHMFENFGFPRIMGEIGAYLYLSQGPKSLDQIGDFLVVSKGSVSTNVRALQRMRFVRMVRVPGDRKDWWEFSGSLWPSLKEALDGFVRHQVDDFKALNSDTIPQLESVVKQGKKSELPDEVHLLERLKDLKSLYRSIDVMVSMTGLFRNKPAAVIQKVMSKVSKQVES